MPFNFSRWIPKRKHILESRWLAPFSEHLHDRHLWRFERYATARGAAIGVFFGFLIPFGQMIFAAIALLFSGRVFGLDYYSTPFLKKHWKRIGWVKRSYLYHD